MTRDTPDTRTPVLAWDGHALMPGPALPAHCVMVADSWLVDHGRVRALAAHQERFARSCYREAGLAPAAVREFVSAVVAEIPARGRWFPRVECVGRPARPAGLVALIRPAPAVSTGVVVTHQRGDPRRRPRVKGPDLAMLAALRESAGSIGAGEVVLLTDAGLVIEGALSAVVWWRDDVLCVPDQSLATLDSVTRGLLTALASSRGLQVRPERATPESLDGLEVWSLSALHGIRPVTGWLHAESAPRLRPPRRAAAWQADLLALARPVALAARGRPRPADRREAGS